MQCLKLNFCKEIRETFSLNELSRMTRSENLACRVQLRVSGDKLARTGLKFAKFAKVSPIKVFHIFQLCLQVTHTILPIIIDSTMYKNLAVVKRDTEKSLCFPGPSASMRNLSEKEHR